MKEKLDNKFKTIKKVVRVTLIILAVIFCAFLGYVMVKFAMNKEYFHSWMEKYGIVGRFSYCLMVIFQVVVALVPGEPLEIAGGYAFGVWQGTVLYLVSATIGGMLVFILVRRYGNNLLEMLFSKEKINELGFLKATRKLDKIKKEMLLIFLFILPGTPKDLLCYFAGLTTISTKMWLIICSLGRLPSLLTSTLGGEALHEKNYVVAVIAFGVALLISMIGIIIYRKVHRRHNNIEMNNKEITDKKKI